MSVLRTRVTGPVMLPDGSAAPNGAKIIFTLLAWDKNEDSVVMSGPVEAVVSAGEIDVTLHRASMGDRQSQYRVDFTYFNAASRSWVSGTLGQILPSLAGPVELADMLAIPAPLPDVPDALAQAIGAALAAANSAAVATAEAEDGQASAVAAAASAAAAALFAPAYFTTLAKLLEDETAWPTGTILNTRVEDLAFKVASPSATDHVLTTAGGVKLYVLPGAASTLSRDYMGWVIHSDGQPRINDTVMPAGRENDQWGIYMNVLNDMGRAFRGKAVGMIHCGDVAWRAAMSATSIESAIVALGDMDPSDPGADLLVGVDSAIPGDEYPWGIAPILDAIENRVGISRTRVFAAPGNHDTSGSGLGTNPIANSMATFKKYFGATAYHVIEGNVGFYIMGTENAYDGGGQIAASTIDQARRVIRSHKNVKHWAFAIHHPPAGRHPREDVTPTATWFSPVTVSAGQAASWVGGGEPLIVVGNYAGIRTNRTNLFLVHPHLGRILLVQGRDYDYDTVNTTGIPATPYNQIKILQTWAHGTVTAATVLQLHTVLSLGSVQDGPTTFMLEDLFEEVKPFAVFHGHIGGPDDATETETTGGIRAVAAWGGGYLVNVNMSLPARARLGIHPITAPLVSGFLEFNAVTGTALFRYWNHTATIDGTTGEYTGDWLSVTHPLITTQFTVDFSARGGLDLGTAGSSVDGRRIAGREAQLNFLAMERDISEAPSRSLPLRDANGALITTVEAGVTTPTYSTTAAGRVQFGSLGVTDRSLRDVNPGDGGYVSFELPRGTDSSTAGGSAWRDNQPSREAVRMFWETSSTSDEIPVPAFGFDLLNAAGSWQAVLKMAPDVVTIGARLVAADLLSGVYTPTITNVSNVDIAGSSVTTAAYYRVGNTVTVYGRVSIDPVAANTDTVLRMSLPIPADITVTHAIAGTGAAISAGVMGQTVAINGDPATENAVFSLRPTTTAAVAYPYQFSYRVG